MLQDELQNRTIFCSDNLEVLENINSNTIDLIYLDPPFNKKKVFTAPIGSQAEGAGFSDIFREEDVKDEWVQTIKEDNFDLHNFLLGVKGTGNKYNFCYLCYMAIRLIECQRTLTNTGSLYLHCDPTMSHGLKIVLDCIFKEENFRNEIVWSHQGSWIQPDNKYPRRNDIILFYGKSKNIVFNRLYEDNYQEQINYKRWGKYIVKNSIYGKNMPINDKRFIHYLDAFEKKYKRKPKEDDVVLKILGSQIGTVQYIKVVDPKSKESTKYPTQKPMALLERIIKASSKEGDVVLDPFCGCATTCVVAEKLSRKWIGIDVSKKAFEIVKLRLNKEIPSELWDNKKIHFLKTKNLKRTDGGGKEKEKKYVYIVSNPSEAPYYKVGIAKDWKTRLNNYQTSDKDREYKMEFYYLTTKFREIEKHIHNKFENLHEWVKAKKEDIIKEIKNYSGKTKF